MSRDDYRTRHPQPEPEGNLFNPAAQAAVAEDDRRRQRADLTARFTDFHREHPAVYAALLRLARQAQAAGRNRASIKQMFEVVRWERYIAGLHDGDGFKLNNNLHSRYARLLMLEHPELEGMFELRELHTP